MENMRIAIIQTLYPQGHKTMDWEFVRILSEQHQLIVVDNGNYFPDYSNNRNIKRLKLLQLRAKRWERAKKLLRRLNLLFILLNLKLRCLCFDIILILNCDNDIYKMEHWLPKKKKILMHHNDIDMLLTNTNDRRKFEEKKHCFYHVFLADYIRDNFIRQFHVSSEYVFTVHEPLKYEKKPSLPKEDLLICLGNSTDEQFINDIIRIDKESCELSLPNKLVLRSRKVDFKGRNLYVFKGFLSNKEYEAYFDRAKVCVVYYPDNYKYRYSGIIDDALNKGLVVFCNNTLCGQYFAKVYPGSVTIIKDACNLWDLMRTPLPSQKVKENQLFLSRHSPQYVLEQFNSVINN